MGGPILGGFNPLNPTGGLSGLGAGIGGGNTPLSSLTGTAGGQGGTGYPTTNPTNPAQLAAGYAGTQGALGSQQALLAALQGQNGLQNQSQVYGQMQGIANGTGPNPALAQLNQTTAQNIANQGAMQASQRGASANPELIARQAAQQGGQLQQQSAGQAATMQAQQQLAGIGMAGNMANTMAGNQVGQTNANVQGQQGAYNAQLQANQGYNNNQTSMGNTQLTGQQNLIGGALNGLGVGLGKAAGGEITRMGDGGEMARMADGGMPDQSEFQGPQSRFGQALSNGIGWEQMPQSGAQSSSKSPLTGGMSSLMSGLSGAGGYASGNALLGSEGTIMAGGAGDAALTADAPLLLVAAQGGAADFRTGGKVAAGPGQKAVKAGNSYSNDKIPAVLSEHEIVIPRSVTMGKDPIKNSAKFVASILAKRKGKI